MTSLQHRVYQPSIQFKGDLSNTEENKDELDYRNDFNLTAALQVKKSPFRHHNGNI